MQLQRHPSSQTTKTKPLFSSLLTCPPASQTGRSCQSHSRGVETLSCRSTPHPGLRPELKETPQMSLLGSEVGDGWCWFSPSNDLHFLTWPPQVHFFMRNKKSRSLTYTQPPLTAADSSEDPRSQHRKKDTPWWAVPSWVPGLSLLLRGEGLNWSIFKLSCEGKDPGFANKVAHQGNPKATGAWLIFSLIGIILRRTSVISAHSLPRGALLNPCLECW